MQFLDLTSKLLNLLKNIKQFKVATNLVLASLWLTLGVTPCYADTAPSDVVTAFHAALTTAMKSSSYEHRLSVVEPAVTDHFQIHTIARISLGRHWRSLNAEDQAGFQALLKDLVNSTYASRFKEDNGQVFSITATEPIATNRKRVKSILETSTETVTLDYQLQQEDGTWRIYDIVANGVSDLSLKRSNYSAMFKKGGLESVRQEISSNIAANAAEQDE
jgi:phospholipid transport system substrate-binding protein